MQMNQELEKLYTSSEKIAEQLLIQKPSYDKTGLGFFFGQSTKKTIGRNEPNTSKDKEYLSRTNDASKDKENIA